MAKFDRSNQRLNGLNPLAYIGDNSYQPPEFVTDFRPPTPNDSQNFELGTIWLDTSTNVPPKAENIWMLVSLLAGVATWVNFGASTGGTGSSIVGLSGLYLLNIDTHVGYSALFQSQSISSAQAESNSVAPESGTFSKLFVNVITNNSAIDCTLTLNINNVNTLLQVTLPAGMTGVFSDTVHSVVFVQGDLIQFESSQSSAGTQINAHVTMKLVA